MTRSKVIESVAQAIYHSGGGLTDEDYEASFGKPEDNGKLLGLPMLQSCTME